MNSGISMKEKLLRYIDETFPSLYNDINVTKVRFLPEKCAKGVYAGEAEKTITFGRKKRIGLSPIDIAIPNFFPLSLKLWNDHC